MLKFLKSLAIGFIAIATLHGLGVILILLLLATTPQRFIEPVTNADEELHQKVSDAMTKVMLETLKHIEEHKNDPPADMTEEDMTEEEQTAAAEAPINVKTSAIKACIIGMTKDYEVDTDDMGYYRGDNAEENFQVTSLIKDSNFACEQTCEDEVNKVGYYHLGAIMDPDSKECICQMDNKTNHVWVYRYNVRKFVSYFNVCVDDPNYYQPEHTDDKSEELSNEE